MAEDELSRELAKFVLEQLDANHDGKLSVDELCGNAPSEDLKQAVMDLIKKYDLDKDGMLDLNELRKCVQELFNEIHELMKDAVNKDKDK